MLCELVIVISSNIVCCNIVFKVLHDMHLFQFLLTTLPCILLECVSVFLNSVRPFLWYHSRGWKCEN